MTDLSLPCGQTPPLLHCSQRLVHSFELQPAHSSSCIVLLVLLTPTFGPRQTLLASLLPELSFFTLSGLPLPHSLSPVQPGSRLSFSLSSRSWSLAMVATQIDSSLYFSQDSRPDELLKISSRQSLAGLTPPPQLPLDNVPYLASVDRRALDGTVGHEPISALQQAQASRAAIGPEATSALSSTAVKTMAPRQAKPMGLNPLETGQEQTDDISLQIFHTCDRLQLLPESLLPAQQKGLHS